MHIAKFSSLKEKKLMFNAPITREMFEIMWLSLLIHFEFLFRQKFQWDFKYCLNELPKEHLMQFLYPFGTKLIWHLEQ